MLWILRNSDLYSFHFSKFLREVTYPQKLKVDDGLGDESTICVRDVIPGGRPSLRQQPAGLGIAGEHVANWDQSNFEMSYQLVIILGQYLTEAYDHNLNRYLIFATLAHALSFSRHIWTCF